jgi:hypothetical protein
MLVHNHNPRLDKTHNMTPMIKAVRTLHRHSSLHHPYEMHNIKIQIRKTLRTGQREKAWFTSHALDAAGEQTSRLRHLHRKPSATTTAVISSQGHVKMNENVYSTLTSISDIHSITNSVYFRRSFLFWPLLPTHYGCRAILLHLVITLTDTHKLGRAPLDDRSAHRKDLYLTTHNIHLRKASTIPARFEPSFPASQRPLTDAWDRAATGIGFSVLYEIKNKNKCLVWTPHASFCYLVSATKLFAGFSWNYS